jgi:hypothetical protein
MTSRTTGLLVDAHAPSDLVRLFHRLNNQLGVILANSELLESRLADETQRARAAQVVSGALEAIAVVQALRQAIGPEHDRPTRS